MEKLALGSRSSGAASGQVGQECPNHTDRAEPATLASSRRRIARCTPRSATLDSSNLRDNSIVAGQRLTSIVPEEIFGL